MHCFQRHLNDLERRHLIRSRGFVTLQHQLNGFFDGKETVMIATEL